MKNPIVTLPKFLNRYTSLPVLLDILHQKHLVLLDPKTWEDRNDAFYIERYKEEKKLKSVLALCFSSARETFHHWKVFSSGISGVCIEFNAQRLVSAFKAQKIRCEAVRYKLIKTVEKNKPKPQEWPYLKRWPYGDEKEFRMVYESKTDEALVKAFPITLSWINRVTLSPWMPKQVADSVIAVLRAMPECKSLKVNRSSLLENSRWKRAVTPNLNTN